MDAHDVLAAKVSEMRLAGVKHVVVTLWLAKDWSSKGVVKDIHAESAEIQLYVGTPQHPKLSTSCVVINRRDIVKFVIEDYYV
jgi:hypothetical protein